MRISNLVLSILFLLFTIVQFNDPDPFKWILLYGLTAGICGFSAFGKKSKIINIITLLIVIIWMGILAPEFLNWIQEGMPSITETMKVEEPYIEYTREFLGLLICLLAMIFQFYIPKK
jgi:hypothetical protein